ncbi:Outer membrane protein assembly factor BamD [Fundidesulfovibrio magnetotacticus]|uniref:Outer membrane protein assembly factor BamD n=1 Tax=Fundidesulfovibrio magnetotacticus TaxID=2730080 RepID=A0A6V8LYZ8_9BACT|nr:tetratricopeptide repeat protein [Fundidesulfovibrio magnetotacticus]GFK95016.1 Outer membrane protein assembly factor BamD [Fundidesulfovibrio magnetotacticus]
MPRFLLAASLAVLLAVSVQPAQAAKKAAQLTEAQMISATYAQGVDLMNARKWNAAIEAFTKVIDNAKTPKDILANAYADRGACKANKKQTDEAVLDFNKALELNPDLQNALYERGRALAMQGKHAEAYKDFSKAIEKSQPSIITAGYYYNRGICAMNMSPPNPEQAKQDFAMAKKLNPKLKIPEKYKSL